ncbi:glycosyltransferase family 4 protein [Patescibacteria group bacterium]|nr:glycosyltransferase family 4 protein [Patescibacteria group bacterium]
MRIGIDARFFGPFGKGLGRYTQKLITSLEKIDQRNEYFIFLRKENFEAFKPQGKNFNKVLADYRWYTLKEQIMMPKLLKKYRLDLVHFPHFNVPVFYFGSFVVTIHDLIITHFPTKKATTLGPLLYKIKQWGYKVVISWAVRRAKKIITVSEFSKNELLEYFGLKPDKVVVTYEAGTAKKEEYDFNNLSQKFGLKKPYLLYVGNAYPHKNIEKLVLAFKRLQHGSEFYDMNLVLVGRKDYFFKRIEQEAIDLSLKNVFFPGFVSDSELSSLYENAFIYVFPSYYEGFGLPPLEAMSYGLPVISSNTTSMPEILGDAAEYFDPQHVDQIAKKISEVAKNKELREKMIHKGLERVKLYSWKSCAEETLDCYQQVNVKK